MFTKLTKTEFGYDQVSLELTFKSKSVFNTKQPEIASIPQMWFTNIHVTSNKFYFLVVVEHFMRPLSYYHHLSYTGDE